MSWRATASPFFYAGSETPVLTRRGAGMELEATSSTCPEGLVHVLSINDLRADESTVRDGNCALDALMKGLWNQGVRNRAVTRVLQSADPIGRARAAGIDWLRANERTEIWDGMQMHTLCRVVSGAVSFREYTDAMARNHEWVDAAFLHAVANAFQVDVCVFQLGVEPVLLGVSLQDSRGGEAPLVPIALVNDFHFWGVVEETAAEVPPVDKGDIWPIQQDQEQSRPRKRRRADQDEASDDGEDPKTFFDRAAQAGQVSSDRAAKELILCQALGRWNPWAAPAQELLEAMEVLASSGCAVDGATVLARADAVLALSYEEAHFEEMPEALKYHKGALYRLLSPAATLRRVLSDRRATTRAFLEACASITAKNHLENLLREGCSRGAEACLRAVVKVGLSSRSTVASTSVAQHSTSRHHASPSSTGLRRGPPVHVAVYRPARCELEDSVVVVALDAAEGAYTQNFCEGLVGP